MALSLGPTIGTLQLKYLWRAVYPWGPRTTEALDKKSMNAYQNSKKYKKPYRSPLNPLFFEDPHPTRSLPEAR